MEMVASKFAKQYHYFVASLFTLVTLLPIFNIKSFNSDKEELESNLYFIFDMDRSTLYNRQLFYIIILLLVISSLSVFLFLKYNENNGSIVSKVIPFIVSIPLLLASQISWRITIVGILFYVVYFIIQRSHGYVRFSPFISSSIVLYLLDEELRRPFIDNAYARRSMFDNVAPASIGYILLILAIILSLYLNKVNLNHSGKEFQISLKNNLIKRIKSLWGPTSAQYLGFHITTLIIMMITYGIENGNFFYGPIYYLQLVYSYGLNSNLELPIWINLVAYILAPIIVITFCSMLFFMKASGYAPNGPGIELTAPESRYYELTRLRYQDWSYFGMDVPLAETYYFDNPKLSQFYLFTIFGSIIIGFLLGSVIRHFTFGKDKGAKLYSYFRLMFLSAIFTGYTIGTLTAPLIIVPGGIVGNIFNTQEGFRFRNRFLLYKYLLIDHADNGNYHPLSIAWALVIFSIPMILIAVSIDLIIKKLFSGTLFEKKESKQIIGRTIDERKTKLPWD